MILFIRKILIFTLIFLPVIAVIIMLITWQIQKEKPMATLVINKSLIAKDELRQQPFFWVLKHNHFVRPNGVKYSFENDFLGFKPQHNGKTYSLVTMDKLSNEKIHYFAENMMASYYVGTNAWCYNAHYGEMTYKDFNFITTMKRSGKLVINEFNVIRSPWSKLLRMRFETEFGIKSTGWIGGYFASLDTLNTDLPPWIIQKYMKQNHGSWPFTHDGIVFLHEKGNVVILDGARDLVIAQPLVRTMKYGSKYYQMPGTVKFSQWFDIIQITDSLNHALSAFELRVSEKGRQLMMEKNIPTLFPAVVMQKTEKQEYYYFCGNFSAIHIPTNSLYLAGGQHIALMLDARRENFFFYKFYRPLVTSILKNYYQQKVAKK